MYIMMESNINALSDFTNFSLSKGMTLMTCKMFQTLSHSALKFTSTEPLFSLNLKPRLLHEAMENTLLLPQRRWRVKLGNLTLV